LIFSALRHWITPASRVLILDPMYGEYAHVFERVIGARVDRLALSRESGYELDEQAITRAVQDGYDLVVLVNPNSPTGRYLHPGKLLDALAPVPCTTRIWVDETYVDFAGGGSLEPVAAASSNVVVCKSMSKAFALSGARVGYLCGPPALLREVRALCPPWSVSLPAQIAACEALRATEYYEARWRETARLRKGLTVALRALGWDVVSGRANFVLCHLPGSGPSPAWVAQAARLRGLLLRELGNMGRTLGGSALRVAVKDELTNRRMVAILTEVLSTYANSDRPAGRDPGGGQQAEADRGVRRPGELGSRHGQRRAHGLARGVARTGATP
jgi:histidinol-phosphate/aromatic aminotransferase/cobyric acid decarboxylase-like protein